MATIPTFLEFEAAALSEGFDEVVERTWPADARIDTHSHEFAVDAVVVEGEMWLTLGEQTRHLRPGDRFALSLGAPHAERYGAQGATYWAARRKG